MKYQLEKNYHIMMSFVIMMAPGSEKAGEHSLPGILKTNLCKDRLFQCEMHAFLYTGNKRQERT